MSASEGKSPQVHARPGHTESQVDPSFLLASTCESIWPGLKHKNIRTKSIVSSEGMLLMLTLMSQLSSLANKLLMLMLILTMYACVAI